MKVVQLHEYTPKQISNPSPTQKIAHLGPKKSKIAPKFIQNQMSELKETMKMKVVQLHEYFQTIQPPGLRLTIRNSTFHQLSSKTQKTKIISLYEETPKQFLNPTPTPKIAN